MMTEEELQHELDKIIKQMMVTFNLDNFLYTNHFLLLFEWLLSNTTGYQWVRVEADDSTRRYIAKKYESYVDWRDSFND